MQSSAVLHSQSYDMLLFYAESADCVTWHFFISKEKRWLWWLFLDFSYYIHFPVRSLWCFRITLVAQMYMYTIGSFAPWFKTFCTLITITAALFFQNVSSNSKLLIKNAQLKHAGHYTCTALTPIDNVTASAHLVVRGELSGAITLHIFILMKCHEAFGNILHSLTCHLFFIFWKKKQIKVSKKMSCVFIKVTHIETTNYLPPTKKSE